ncbi:hypothetical protein VZT92_014725 [Zoarces viviparus]|uniref:Uncharacterized protein n=1 Tax=Zoarces viviparus TaxID=48416 RepID=A0AAW1F0M7_ZOAVI
MCEVLELIQTSLMERCDETEAGWQRVAVISPRTEEFGECGEGGTGPPRGHHPERGAAEEGGSSNRW